MLAWLSEKSMGGPPYEMSLLRTGVPPAAFTSLAKFSRLVWNWLREMPAASFWSLCPNLRYKCQPWQIILR